MEEGETLVLYGKDLRVGVVSNESLTWTEKYLGVRGYGVLRVIQGRLLLNPLLYDVVRLFNDSTDLSPPLLHRLSETSSK